MLGKISIGADTIKKAALYISASLYVLVFAAALYIYNEMKAPDLALSDDLYINIPAGTDIKTASQILKSHNLIKNENLFTLWTRFRYGSIKAGDYLFKKPQSAWTISKRLYQGAHGIEPVRILIKEGATRREIAELLQKKMLRFNPDKFLLITHDKEGYLFPDTYFILPNLSEEKVAQIMLDNFNKKIKPYIDDIEKSGMTLDEVITLASIVEREASKYEDRRKIAGVLLNRLKINMPLQVDATWFYTHNKGTPGITLKDLKDKNNPYNTYIHKGLPPSPIGSPGIDSIKAVLYPIKSDYLFYLADKEGNTYYSKTYKEHMIKREKYLK